MFKNEHQLGLIHVLKNVSLLMLTKDIFVQCLTKNYNYAYIVI